MQHPEKYALTLELGKTEKGKVPGKIYLCVPDAQKSYLAGTFVAERKRSMWDPPGDDEVPFIHGSVSPPVKAKEFVHVGYVGATTDGKTVSDLAGMVVNGEESQAICSRTHAPRQAALQIEKFVPRFDFSNLPPGRYLIFARVKDGPAAWSWVEVAAGAKVPADLKLDAAKLGSVEVKLAGGGGHPRLAPADLGPAPLPADFLGQLEFSLDFNPVTKDGVVTFASVPAGKYRVRDGTLTADIEVTASKTATVELKPGKK